MCRRIEWHMKANKGRRAQRIIFAAGIGSVALLVLVGWGTIYSSAQSISFSRNASSTPEEITKGDERVVDPNVTHIKTPVPMKAIYMSQCAAGTPSFREDLTKLIDTTELNSIIIDIRDYTGKIAFPTDNPALAGMTSDACGAKDMKEFVKALHAKKIYVIGRITVFQNPYYTSLHPEQAVQRKSGGVWKDYKGLAFVDVGAKPYWDNVVELAKESYAIGFDELNFDYIRFPSDGPMSEAHYSWDNGKSKPEMLEEFYKYLHEKLEPLGVVTSADLFGMVTTNTDDLNIGQVLERALPYFDYVAPMVYPSHYPKGFHGYANVNANAYNIVHFAMSEAVRRTTSTTSKVDGLTHTKIMKTVEVPGVNGAATTTRQEFSGLYEKPAYPASKMRPWVQSFDYPVTYTPAMVAEQIKAAKDVGLDSYYVWDPANKYRSLRQVLQNN